MKKPIPRWQQGWRPNAYGDVWDRMTPEARRSAFIGDVAIIGAALLFFAVLAARHAASLAEFWRTFSPILGWVVAIVALISFANWRRNDTGK